MGMTLTFPQTKAEMLKIRFMWFKSPFVFDFPFNNMQIVLCNATKNLSGTQGTQFCGCSCLYLCCLFYGWGEVTDGDVLLQLG